MTATPPKWFAPYRARISWLEFNQNLQVDLPHGYVYFEVAKAACSTIKSRLNPVAARGLPEPKTVHPAVFESAFAKPFQLTDDIMAAVLSGQNFTRFTFIREPMERFVSGYLDKFGRASPQQDRFRKRHFPDIDPEAVISAEMFLSALENDPKFRAFDKHWRPQTELLFQPEQELDFIGTLERFEEDWDLLCERLDLPVETLRNDVVWHATSAAEKVNNTLTPDQKRRVEHLFAADFEFYENHARR